MKSTMNNMLSSDFYADDNLFKGLDVLTKAGLLLVHGSIYEYYENKEKAKHIKITAKHIYRCLFDLSKLCFDN